MPDIADLKVHVGADTRDAESGLERVSGAIGGFGKVAGLAMAGAGLAIVGAGAAAVASASDFEATMSGVKAVSGATADELKGLSGLALQLGKDTSFSASEAASGIEELVKGGLTIPDIMDGAAQATLNLAAAGGVSLPDAATLAANALAQFNLKGKDMAHVSDLIAGAANASALDVGQFKFSLQAAGAVAATVGFSFDDLAQGIAIMGKAGITGSDAGTSLKTMMMQLNPTTDKARSLMKELGIITETGANNFFDATGKVRSMDQVAQVLQTSLRGLTEQQKLSTLQTLFGSDAIRAGAVLAKEGSIGFQEMATAMGKVTAEQVGLEKMNNLKGDWQALTGSIETLAIQVGTGLLPALRTATQGATGFINSLIPLAEKWGPVVADVLVKIGGAVTDFIKSGGDLGLVADDLREAFGIDIMPFVDALRIAQGALQAIIDGWNAGGLAGAFSAWMGQAGTFFTSMTNWIGSQIPAIQAALLGWAQAFIDWIGPQIGPFLTSLGQIINQLTGWIVAQAPVILAQMNVWGEQLNKWIEPMIPPILAAAGRLSAAFLDWIGDQVGKISVQVGKWAKEFSDWIAPAVTEFLRIWPGQLNRFLDWIESAAGPIAHQILNWALAFTAWIVPMIPDLLVGLGKILLAIGVFIGETAIAIGQRMPRWSAAFTDWIASEAAPKLGTALVELHNRLNTFIYDTSIWIFDSVVEWGRKLVSGFVDGLRDMIHDVWQTVEHGLSVIGQNAVDFIRDIGPRFVGGAVGWGENIVNGVVDGLRNIRSRIVGFIRDEFGGMYINVGPFHLGPGGFNIDPPHIDMSRVFDVARSVPWRDDGGPGQAGRAYMIGTGAQPELFIPQTDGTFHPNAVLASAPAPSSQPGGAFNGTVIVQVGEYQLYGIIAKANSYNAGRGIR